MGKDNNLTAYFHLPGLFEFFDFYKVFLPLYRNHREYFYDWCHIGSIYGAPEGTIWGGGRIGIGKENPINVLKLMEEYGISSRLTFSNSKLCKEHLEDEYCNKLCQIFEASQLSNGVIVHSDLLLAYLKSRYPKLYFISSTTKVQTDFNDFCKELDREDFKYVVPDFRLNKSMDKLSALTNTQKDKVEFLCNECCYVGCTDRYLCYERVSRQNIGEDCEDFKCTSPTLSGGYRFSQAMENPMFIGIEDIKNVYLKQGFSNFKIEGRGLGNALLLEFILYYMTKPDCQIKVREEIYLDNMLDLF